MASVRRADDRGAGEFRAAEIRVEQESGARAEERFEAAAAQAGAEGRGAAFLPDNGGGEGAAGGAVPEYGGFALVGEAEGGDGGAGEFGADEGGEGGAAGGGPEVRGAVFDPAGFREMRGEGLLRGGADASAMLKNEGA